MLVIKKVTTRWLNKSLCIDGSNLRSQFRLHSLAKDITDSLNSSARDVPHSLTRDAESTVAERRSKESFLGADLSHLEDHQQADSVEKNHSVGDNNQSTKRNNAESLV